MENIINRKIIEQAYNLKAKLMAYGVDIPSAIDVDFSYKPYIKALYDHDLDGTTFSYPQEIILLADHGPEKNINIYAHVRRNSESSIKLISKNKKIYLIDQENEFEVTVPALPDFYGKSFQDEDGEIIVDKYVQKMGHDVLSIVLSNNCEYYSRKVQCAFCEIVETFQENRILKKPKKDLRNLAKAMAYALSHDKSIKRILLNGGNLSKDNNATFEEIIELLTYCKALVNHELWAKINILLVLMPPSNFELIDQVKEAGATAVYFNLEFWKRDLFAHYTPGKAGYGYDKMLEALEYSTKVFGVGNVYSNLIFGIQSIEIKKAPYEMSVNSEENILLQALKDLADRKIVLTNTIYHSRGKNKLGSIELEHESLSRYHQEYGRLISKYPIIHEDRSKEYATFGGIGSFPNCLCNEGYLLALLEEGNKND